MSWIVVDASVTLFWCFPDEQTPAAMGVLDLPKAGDQALVPAFWCSEVLNSLLLGERKGVSRPTKHGLSSRIFAPCDPRSTMLPWSGCSKTFRRFAANMAWLPTMRFTWSLPCGRGVPLRRWTRISGTLPWRSG